MACRGWYIALLPEEASKFLGLTSVDNRVEFLNTLYTPADADGRQQSVDKSWDAMHRCLCGGWLDTEHGEEAKRACVIGGRQLSDGLHRDNLNDRSRVHIAPGPPAPPRLHRRPSRCGVFAAVERNASDVRMITTLRRRRRAR